ncbi:MAG: hypothetical protein H8E35_02555 [Ardenticatenia bacterium]|nr:hypothetical protein [Ardenticatenia bacterium]
MNQPGSALRYRVGQFQRALTARVSEEEIAQAICILTPEARALFRRQAAQDQRHGLTVYHALRRAGHTNPHLLAAALLHDVGKAAAYLPAWQRAVIVFLRRFAPRLLARLSRGEPQGYALSLVLSSVEGLPKGWRHPFVVHARHPEVGARWAREAGCSPLTVALIQRHQHRLASCQTEEDQLLAALQAADSLN